MYVIPKDGYYQISYCHVLNGWYSGQARLQLCRRGDILGFPDFEGAGKLENVRGVVSDCGTRYISNWNKLGNKYLDNLSGEDRFSWSVTYIQGLGSTP